MHFKKPAVFVTLVLSFRVLLRLVLAISLREQLIITDIIEKLHYFTEPIYS